MKIQKRTAREPLEWEKRLKSILDNYMPNEGIRNLLIRRWKRSLAEALSKEREEIIKIIKDK